ncbi:MAG: hypothetical protein RL557_728 [archaeon]|jgi:predicted nucleotidyltransferase
MKIIKKAVEMGNGAAIYIPKEYSGKEIVILLPDGIKEIKNEILQKLIPYMNNIIGVYLYGSYARHEQTKDSDIDILIITKEKDEKIKNALKDMDVRIITQEGIKNAIKEYPLLVIPILKEAEVLLNPSLLEELQKEGINIKKFKWNFDEIKRAINITKKFIEIDEENISPIHIYSLMMRIRACYLIECLLKDKKFSNKGVENKLIEQGLKKELIDDFLFIYRAVRENEELHINIKKDNITQLISIIKNYSKELEDEAKKKIRKRY